ncbi:MAG: endonuclease/exonuclease/phosphatase family protein [bacterium]|nr:endonuclease/exonuclease/phosphatase family protein [bacterium]
MPVKHYSYLLILLCLALLGGYSFATPGANKNTVDTKIMSFNIRYAGANDGENGWDKRRYLVRRAIRDHKPAIFGIQECLWDQGLELNEAFYGYRITGVGRDDGVQAGEMCLIFTRYDRYHLLDQGNFWLSEQPEEPGSKGWDAACPRIVTWVKLRDRRCNPDTLYVFNTHLDHAGPRAREEGSRLLQTRMKEIAAGHEMILLGDFNADASGKDAPYKILVEEGYLQGLSLRDSYLFASGAEKKLNPGTWHGFTGKASRGRIDWILTTGGFRAVDAGIERLQMNGRYPSDHFPVWANFRQERHPPLPSDQIDGSTGATPKY